MCELFEADLQTHSETLSLDVLVVDTMLHELSIKGELTNSAANSADNLA